MKFDVNSEFIYTRSGTNIVEGLIKMLLNGRVEMVLSYPQDCKYFTERLNVSEKIMFLPIKGMPEYNGAWVDAPKTAWGKEMIGKINTIILEKRHTPEYLSFYENWVRSLL